jgi:hypothetical protein
LGIPGLLRKMYVDLTVNPWLWLRAHVNWLCMFLVVAASMMGCNFSRSLRKKVECPVSIFFRSIGMVWFSDCRVVVQRDGSLELASHIHFVRRAQFWS